MEAVSNPIAPEVFTNQDDVRNHKMSNSDFRKLLMTPRPATHYSNKDDSAANDSHTTNRSTDRLERNNDPVVRRNKQKQIYKQKQSKQKKDNQKPDVQVEPTPRYRDRAKERRAGKLSVSADDLVEENDVNEEDHLTQTADYRSVAPSLVVGTSHAERRRMIIQESKYLGGDMEHTHLVKGLDYVLLQKVRLEIQNKELEAEQILDAELTKPEKVKDLSNDDGLQFSTKLGSSICNILFSEKPLERNEYFYPGRMTYRIELEDDSVDFEVPATVIHSKSDCLQMDGQGSGAITTNEIVINKLTQILSYLRAGKRQAKKNKLKGRTGFETDGSLPHDSKVNSQAAHDIFEGVGSDYVPTSSNSRNRHTGTSESSRDDKKARNVNSDHVSESQHTNKSSYFDKTSSNTGPVANTNSSVNSGKEFMNELSQRFGIKDDNKLQEKASFERFCEKTKVTCYDECYPGFADDYDDDSDDDTDFSKMDLGSKKRLIGRWDFETQEEYSDYMSHKEAMPKAAFQYGLKMADGRKTRRLGPKDEKNELDKQLQQIQSIIQKRKTMGENGGASSKNPRF